MKRSYPYVAVLLLAALTAGCGNSTRPKSSAAAGATSVTSGSDTTPIATNTTPAPTTMNATHGEVVMVPTQTGGRAMAFLPDGQNEAFEITDDAALKADGARLGTTLTIDADIVTNMGGKTSLTQAVSLVTFESDDVAAYGTLSTSTSGSLSFRSVDGKLIVPTGPMAQGLAAHPSGRPLFLTGEVVKQVAIGPISITTLEVTAWRPTSELTLTVRGGILNQTQSLRVLDVERRGAYRFEHKLLKTVSKGKGLLSRDDVASLQKVVMKADLRNAKPTYGKVSIKKKGGLLGTLLPTFPIVTELKGSDAKGEFTITMGSKATLPAELKAVVTRMKQLAADAPRSRTLAKGTRSKVKKAAVKTSTNALSFAKLWASHTSADRPTVDFKDAFVVGAFRGTSSKGTISIEQVERIGDDLFVTTRKSTKLIPTIPLPFFSKPAPYAFAVISKRGVKGRIYVDGKRVVSFPFLPPIVKQPLFPKLPFFPKPVLTPVGPKPVKKLGIFGFKASLAIK